MIELVDIGLGIAAGGLIAFVSFDRGYSLGWTMGRVYTLAECLEKGHRK